MILVTGAAGKTGRSIVNALSLRGIKVKALVRSAEQAREINRFGKPEIAIADLRDEKAINEAMAGVSKIYFIAPNMSPDELEIGRNLVRIARQNTIERFVYHSVLHPQVEAMPHHWQKLRMEELLFSSGLDFTILQPCAYMQNLLAGWKSITSDGKYVVPYSVKARISMVDLDDIGQAAANVLTQCSHSNAIYELAGPESLSQVEVAQKLTQVLGRQVDALEQLREEWTNNARSGNLSELQISWLLKMFEYYDQNGLVGNSNTLEHLLDHKPASFSQFLTRINISGGGS